MRNMSVNEAIDQKVSEVADFLNISKIEAISKLQATAAEKGLEHVVTALHNYKMDLIGREDLKTDSQVTRDIVR